MKTPLLILAIILLPITFLFYDSYHPDKSVEELSKLYANQNSKFIEVDGVNVHYRDEGLKEGPVLLMLHGTNASLHTWEGWVEELKKDFRLVSFDVPPFGLSGPHPEHAYTYPQLAEFTERFVQALGLEKFSLAGNSRGGSIAWHYAVMFPEKTEGLLLLDSSGFPSDKPMPFVFRLQNFPVIKDIQQTFTPKWIVVDAVKQVYGNPELLNEKTAQLYFDMTLREGAREASLYNRAAANKDWSYFERMKEITTPTLIMWGEKDTWILPKQAAKFAETIQNSKVLMYPDLGHVPMEEDPVNTARDAKAFLFEQVYQRSEETAIQ